MLGRGTIVRQEVTSLCIERERDRQTDLTQIRYPVTLSKGFRQQRHIADMDSSLNHTATGLGEFSF